MGEPKTKCHRPQTAGQRLGWLKVRARAGNMLPMRLVLLGAGGHARMVADIIVALGHQLAGLADIDPDRVGERFSPTVARILYLEADLPGVLEEGVLVVPAIGDNPLRIRSFRRLRDYACDALVHPRAVCSPSCRLDAGTVVAAGVVVNACASIGEASIVNTGAIVEHDCSVGAGVHLAPRATLCGQVRVGDGAFIGGGAIVIPGIEIGAGAIVGAGATVVHDVPAGATVVGVPARIIRT